MDQEALNNTLSRFDDQNSQLTGKPFGIPLDPTLEKVLDATKDLPVVRAVRPALEVVTNQLLERLSADIVTIFPYSPYWDEFGIPITSGKMQTIVPPYLRDKLRTFMKQHHETTIFESTETLWELAPQFFEREQIKTVNAAGIYNDGLPIGIIFVKWRKQYELAFSERDRLEVLSKTYHELITHNDTFSYFAEMLHTELEFDLVRLHLFQQEQAGRIQNLAQVRWGNKPITRGKVRESAEWQPTKRGGPITTALNHYLKTRQSFLFQNDVSLSAIFSSGTFTQQQEIATSGYVLLIVNEGKTDEEIVGILFVSWHQQRKWQAAQKSAVLLFAHQMATAIHTRRLITSVEEQSISENWLQELLGHVLRHRTERREDALQLVLETAATLTGAYCGDIRLKSGDRLLTEATFGNEDLQNILKYKYAELPIAERSLTCKAFRTNQSAIFSDAEKDDSYIKALSDTKSEMVVIIRQVESGQPIGTINLEHTQLHGFKESDRKRVIAIADVTAIILRNIERYAYLEAEVRSYHRLEEIAAHGLIGASWLYEAATLSRAIEANTEIIRRQMKRGGYENERIESQLQEIVAIGEEFVARRHKIPRELDGSPAPLPIDQKLQESIRTLKNRYGFDCRHSFKATDCVVPIHLLALKLVIKHLVTNSVQAARAAGIDLVIDIKTKRVDDTIEIICADNGPGIHGDHLTYYMRDRMPKPLRHGTNGMGMNVVQFILRRYNGKIRYLEQVESGAKHKITLPVA